MSERRRILTLKGEPKPDAVLTDTVTHSPVLAIEVDGVRYHKEGTLQYDRDRLKDGIMEKAGIRLLRIPTDSSGQESKLAEALKETGIID